MRVLMSAQLETIEFSTWAQLGGSPLPMPLNVGNAANATVPIEVLAQGVRDSRADPDWVNPIEASVDRLTRQMLVYTRRLLSAPDYVVYALRVELPAEQGTTIAGFVRDQEAVVITDGPQTVRLAKVAVPDVARAVVDALPPFKAYPLTPGRYSRADFETWGALVDSGADDQTLARAALARGVDPGTALAQLRIRRGSTAHGHVFAFGLLPDGAMVKATHGGAVWVESVAGAIVERSCGTKGLSIEPGTHDALLKAIVQARAAIPAR